MYIRDPAEEESVTVIECIAAAGYAIDCFVIMPSKVYLEKMFDNNLPARTKIVVTEKGYSGDDLAIKWLWYFHHQIKGKQYGQYRVLIFDGHGSHMTHKLILLFEDLKVNPFCLMAHSTHATQPLDVACFQFEKHWHGRAIEDRIREGCNSFTRFTFLQCLNQIRKIICLCACRMADEIDPLFTIISSLRSEHTLPLGPSLSY